MSTSWAQKLREKSAANLYDREERIRLEFQKKIDEITRSIEAQASKGFFSFRMLFCDEMTVGALQHIYNRDPEGFSLLENEHGDIVGISWE